MPTHERDLYPGDELYLEPLIGGVTCRSRQPDDDKGACGFTCTLAKGHDGDHAAHGGGRIPPQYARWSQS